MCENDIVRFRYSAGSTSGAMRVVRVNSVEGDTLHAFDYVHNAVRNFKTSKMSEVEVLANEADEDITINDLEDENYELREQLNELQSRIDELECSDCDECEVGQLNLSVYKDGKLIFTASSEDNSFDLNFDGKRFVFSK